MCELFRVLAVVVKQYLMESTQDLHPYLIALTAGGSGFASGALPLGALRSQMTVFFKNNKSEQNRKLESLRIANTFRCLDCNFFGFDDDYIIQSEIYEASVDKFLVPNSNDAVGSAAQKLKIWIAICPKRSVLKRDLLNGNTGADIALSSSSPVCAKFSPDELDTLIKIGFFRLRRDSSSSDEIYSFSHPKLGVVLGYLLDAKQKLIPLINKTKHKEITEKELFLRAGQAFGSLYSSNDSEALTIPVVGSRKRKRGSDMLDKLFSIRSGHRGGSSSSGGKTAADEFVLMSAGFKVLGLRYILAYLVGVGSLARLDAPLNGHVLRIINTTKK